MDDVSGLVASTRRLDDEIDLVALAGDDGHLFTRGRSGLVGHGRAHTITVPRADPTIAAKAVHDVLDTIAVDDEVGLPGTGPVAMGALPFSPTVDGVLVVPELVIGRGEDGTRWITTIGADRVHAPDTLDLPAMAPTDRAAPTTYALRSERDPGEWCDAVAEARQVLRAGTARKVVLARAVSIDTDRPLSIGQILRHLAEAYPSCMLYSADGFVGASPELLVARAGDHVWSHPMAGTAPRSSDPSTDARLAAQLLASTKDREEHRLTIDMVHDTLLPWCSYLDEEAEPQIVAMANVSHLATRVEGRLSSPPASVIELMTALHPTPAVGGDPRSTALELIGQMEGLDRGRYGGPVGWVDGRGNGTWAVGIRCAEIDGNRARLFAGVGVLPDSDPQAELAETRAKLQALLGAVVRP
jgi:isochorismate synthase